MTGTATDAPQLIIPYTLDANDMRFATPQGFNSGDQFFAYLKDSFDTLYAEGKAGAAAHDERSACIAGWSGGRAASPRSSASSTTSKGHDKVWLARRIDIARHWRETHPYPACRRCGPSRMGSRRLRRSRSAASSSIRRGSPSAPTSSNSARPTTVPAACTTRSAACSARASEAERLGVLNAHPDLAGKLAQAKRLTPESTREQASAGLDALTDAERELLLRSSTPPTSRSSAFPSSSP